MGLNDINRNREYLSTCRRAAGFAVALALSACLTACGRSASAPPGKSAASPVRHLASSSALDIDSREPISPIKTRSNPIDGAVMVWVPAGKFIMGDGQDRNSDNPEHVVSLKGFWIYKNEVTVGEYQAFCDATSRFMPSEPYWGWNDNDPMVNVTWEQASAYAKWAHATLPTEAQFEKAARGTDGRVYPWGNAWDPARCSNSVSSELERPAPAGSFPAGASPYGALDMAGNVLEWCSDYYSPDFYARRIDRDPAGPATGTSYVLRGGSWNYNRAAGFRSARRYDGQPWDVWDFNGFRCVVAAGGK